MRPPRGPTSRNHPPSLLRSHRVKRALDLAGAGAALLAAAPVMAASSVAIWVRMGRPILFRQTRPGLGGAPFQIYKFRTMTSARGADGALLPDEERQTRLGQFLRATSIDELLELLNVLQGAMSLVGPRPLFESYLPLYTAEQARRHDVKPGVTGLAQVRGRNALSWDEKFALDVCYVDTWSLALDLRILVETIRVVMRREGISHPNSATMPIFTGSAKP